MQQTLEFIKENVSWIKDVAYILFAFTGALLAILSYRKARATIFQPKRTEAIKIQLDVLTEFLSLFASDGNTIDRAIDYTNIYRYNVDLALRDYNLMDEEILLQRKIKFEQDIGGWFQFLEDDIYEFVLIEGSIEEYDRMFFEPNNRERQKNYEAKAKEGEVTIHRIFYTKKYALFHKKLRDLSENPFMPKDIQEVANQIGENVLVNLHYNLRTLLTKLVKDTYAAYQDKESDLYELISDQFKYQTLWRVFETERRQHKQDYELLKERIRKHLLIDKKW